MKNKIDRIYKRLILHFGPQGWWPADTAFEVMIGAILTQNTNWKNVERAIGNLKQKKLLNVKRLYRVPVKQLAALIRPAGYFNIKAKRLKQFLKFFFKLYRADLRRLRQADTDLLRNQLLAVKGIGPETADSILLYALDKPVFVVDAYTKRILARHAMISQDADYSQIQDLFKRNLRPKIKLFNEYHALLVRLGKEFCLKKKPKCNICPLKEQMPGG